MPGGGGTTQIRQSYPVTHRVRGDHEPEPGENNSFHVSVSVRHRVEMHTGDCEVTTKRKAAAPAAAQSEPVAELTATAGEGKSHKKNAVTRSGKSASVGGLAPAFFLSWDPWLGHSLTLLPPPRPATDELATRHRKHPISFSPRKGNGNFVTRDVAFEHSFGGDSVALL